MKSKLLRIYQKTTTHSLWPILLLALVCLATFATTLIFKRRTFYVFMDNIDQFYAWYQKLTYAVHQGTLPIWDANKNAGHSFVGELQTGVFYPINLLWVWLFGSAKGISIFWLEAIVVFHFWLASVGMYLAARALGLNKYGAFASGLVYAYGGGVAVRSVSQTAIFFGLCFIPWIFFAFKTYLDTRKIRYLLLCGICQGLIILAGHIQPWFHANFLLGLFILFYATKPSRTPIAKLYFNRIKPWVLSVLLGFVIAAPQLLLSAQYLPQAYRFVGDAKPIGPSEKVSFVTYTKTFSYKPQDTLSLVDPTQFTVVDGNEVYVGLAALAIVALVLLKFRGELAEHVVWRQNKRFITLAIGITGLIMMGYWTFIPGVLRLLPLFSQVRQLARYSIIVQFCLAVLLGIAVEVLSQHAPKRFASKKMQIGLLGTAGFLSLNAIYMYLASKHGAFSKHFVYQGFTLALLGVVLLLFRKRLSLGLVTIVVISSITQPVWFLPKIAALPATYAPTYYRRTSSITYLEKYFTKSRVMIEDGALPVNIGDLYNIQTTNGYGATLHKNFYDYLMEPETKDTEGIHMDLLNVQFMVSKKVHPELVRHMYDAERQVYVYERPNFVPRAYMADQLTDCRPQTPACTPIMVTSYADNKIVLTTPESTKSGRLVLSEVMYDGWKAKVDGKSVEIQSYSPTNVKLFRSVQIPAGKHIVEFSYL